MSSPSSLLIWQKKLPDDVEAKIKELAADEKNPLAKTIYETMHKNMDLAYELNRPSCQDTGYYNSG